MKLFRPSSVVAAAVVVALAGCANQGVQSSASTAVSAASQQAQTQVKRQEVATALYELAYSSKQNAVFVASAGGFGPDAPAPKVLRLHPDTLAVQAEIALEHKGFGVALDDAANRLYVGNTNDASITVVDTAANRVIGVVQLAEKVKTTNPEGKAVERYPHNFRELVVDKANYRLFAPGLWFEDSALYVVDTRTLKLEKVIPGLGFVATGITLDEKAGKVYVTNLQGQLYTINTKSLAIEGKAETGGDQLLNLVLDKNKQRILATDQGLGHIDGMRKNLGKLDYQNSGAGNQVLAIDPANGKTLAAIPTAKGPVALLLDERRNRLYVTSREGGTVAVFDANTYAPLKTFDLPAHPNSLTLDEKTGVVYATVKNGQDAARGTLESVVRIQL